MLSGGHSTIGEVGRQVKEHSSCSKWNGVGVALAGHNTIQRLPQFCTTVSSIIATVCHSAGLMGVGGSGVGVVVGGGWGRGGGRRERGYLVTVAIPKPGIETASIAVLTRRRS